MTGRVAGRDEVPLSIPAAGRIQSVNVKPGQTVQEGQVLVEADSRAIQRDLSSARARLETELLRQRQLQAQIDARKQENDRKAQLDQSANRRLIAEAEASLTRAQAEYDKVKAGALPADREAAEGAVAAAKAALERAEADLAKAVNGPPSAEMAAADQQLTTSRLALQKAEADVARLKQGADPAAVRGAERDLLLAQNDLDRAQAELNRLTNGRDPFDVRAAEREVERARISLQSAEAIPPTNDNRSVRDANIATARVGIKEAEERLARLKEPAKQVDIDTARRAVDSARLAVDGAQDRLSQVKKGPDQLTIDTAQATVEGSRLAVQSAETRVAALQAGSPADQVTAAQNAVNSAKSALSIAEARRTELLSHPLPAELQEAEQKLAAAKAAYERNRAEVQGATQPFDPASFDLEQAKLTVESARAQVETIERELASTKLKTPFAAMVVSVQVRSGDPVEPGQPIVVLAKTAGAIVRADLNDKDVSRVTVDQSAVIKAEGKDGATYAGAVTGVGASETGVGTTAELMLGLPDGTPPPAFGTSVQVTVTVGTKEGVLIVPQKAVRSAGTRRFVEYMDGPTRRIADVQLGATAGDDVEITSGLKEGQVVLVTQ
jgi:RND family efflux transporter MFP subunit